MENNNETQFGWITETFIGPLTRDQAEARLDYVDYCRRNGLDPECINEQ
jgi:hypothetical protein